MSDATDQPQPTVFEMTPRQIELAQSSFDIVEPKLQETMLEFYKRLFELDPSLSRLFRRPLQEQARKLAHFLTVVIRGLSCSQRILPVIEELGRRHIAFGARREHYATFAEALLCALENALGDAFTSEVREAWACVYVFLASTMQRSAANAFPQPVRPNS